MRLIKLEIQGLNSFIKKTEVDFQSLFNKGVFGIFGATGSGKSSILDAIFLALYGKVLRTKTEKEFINTNTKSAKVKLLFEMREEGVDKIFEVSRDYTINNNGNVVKRARLVLVNGEERTTLSLTDEETTEKINEIIGFGEDEFQRFIALPQGQFAKFLNDSPKNKIDTIAKLFNLDDFGEKFGIKLKYEKSENEKRKEYLRGVLEQYVEIDETTIEKEDRKLISLKSKAKSIAKEYSKGKAALLEGERIFSFLNEKNEIEERLKKLKLQERKFDEDFYKLNVLKTTFALAPSYSKIGVIKEELASLENKRDELTNKITATSNAYFQTVSVNDENKTNLMVKLAECERRHSLLLAVSQDADHYYELEKDKNVLVKKIAKERKQLKQLEENYNSNTLSLENSLKILTELDKAIEIKPVANDVVDAVSKLTLLKSQAKVYEDVLAGLEIELSNLQNRKQNLINELVVSDEKLNKFRKQLYNANKSLNEFFGDESSAEEALENSVKELDNLKIKGTFYLSSIAEIKELKIRSSSLYAKIKDEKEILGNVENDITETDKQLNKAQNELRDLQFLKDKAQNENLIDFLKRDVVEGDKCPICSNLVGKIENRTAPQQKNYEFLYSQKLEEIEKLNTLKNDLFVSYTETNQNILFLNEERDSVIKQVAILTRKQKLIAGENNEFEQLTDELLKSKIDKQEAVVEKLQGLIKALNKTKDATYSKERICVKISANVEEYNKQEVVLNEKIDNIQTIINNLNTQAKELEELEKEGALKDATSFAKFNEQQNLILKQQKDVVPDIIKFTELKEKSSVQYFNFKAEYRQDELKFEQISLEMKQIVKKLRDLNIKGYVKDEIASNLSNIETVRQQLSEINNHETELLKSETNFKIEKASTITQIVVKSKELELANTEFKGQCDLAQLSEDDLKNEVVYDDIVQLESKVNKYKEDLDDAKDDLKRVENILNGKSITKEDLVQIEGSVKSLEDEYVECATNAMVLEKQIQKERENVKKLAYFKTEYLEVVEKEKYFEELAKINGTDELLKFITEEYILNITEKANGYFAMLTNGRYQLLFDNDFIVVDNINGGATRSVGTLSGGETFLASLSVAISIVETLSVIKDKPLDFVFLDEGFGTLDENSIEMVMAAIRNLRNTKLVFGLITHEELVKFKTPSRIEVFKTAKEGSKVEIVI